jgi:DNA uptake protein ComE-like DNA-binding protein
MKFVRLITLAITLSLFGGSLNGPLPAQTHWSRTEKKAAADLVDINHATAGELKTLPGIGDAYSAAIIKHRPYKNKTQLRSGGVIPEATYNRIRDKIIAKQ